MPSPTSLDMSPSPVQRRKKIWKDADGAQKAGNWNLVFRLTFSVLPEPESVIYVVILHIKCQSSPSNKQMLKHHAQQQYEYFIILQPWYIPGSHL